MHQLQKCSLCIGSPQKTHFLLCFGYTSPPANPFTASSSKTTQSRSSFWENKLSVPNLYINTHTHFTLQTFRFISFGSGTSPSLHTSNAGPLFPQETVQFAFHFPDIWGPVISCGCLAAAWSSAYTSWHPPQSFHLGGLPV